MFDLFIYIIVAERGDDMSKGQQNNDKSYFFTCVIYPEFTRLNKLYDLGYIYESPIHYDNPDELLYKKLNYCGSDACRPDYKPHKHILIKTAKKLTENAFLDKIIKLLNYDITGIAIHKGECLVGDAKMMIRYFYHLDNPTKEHFDINTAFDNVYPCFASLLSSAFDTEICHILTWYILSNHITKLTDVLTFNGINTLVFESWLRQGRNLYYIKSFLEQYKEEDAEKGVKNE